MSPRAACRLASLGFEHVYDYVPGKVDWLARGLPVEGDRASEPRAVDVARRDVVICELHTTVGDLRDQVARSPYGFALVLGPDAVLLGRLHNAALQDHPDARAEDVMQAGPSTTRPDHPPDKLLAKLQHADLTTALLTDPEGHLLGIVRRGDLQAGTTATQPRTGSGG